MTVDDVVRLTGLSESDVIDRIQGATEAVLADRFLAIRVGNQTHIVADIRGLGGRKLVRDVTKLLHRWHETEPVLYAPVKLGHERALRIVKAFGFRQYATTATHAWLMREKQT